MLTAEKSEWVKTTSRPMSSIGGRVEIKYARRSYIQADFGLLRMMILNMSKTAVNIAALILDEVNRSDNIFCGTYEEIQEKAGTARTITIKAMKELRKEDFIRKYKNGRWMLNPAVGIGCRSDRLDDLLDQYHRLQPYTSKNEEED